MAEKKCDHNQLLCEGKNCWRIAHADRVAFLIDGASYLSAFMSAVERAKRSVLIVGWDFDSRITLQHDEKPLDGAEQLQDFLKAVISRRNDLHIHILVWDFAVIYALDKGAFSRNKARLAPPKTVAFSFRWKSSRWCIPSPEDRRG